MPFVDTAKTASAPAEFRSPAEQTRALAEFGIFALQSDDLSEVLARACRLAVAGLGERIAKIIEVRGDALYLRHTLGFDPAEADRWLEPGHGSSAGHALMTGTATASSDAAADTRFDRAMVIADMDIRSLVNVLIPDLTGRQDWYGVLEVDSRDARGFSDYEIAFLQSCANLVAAAIGRQKVRREEAAEARARTWQIERLGALFEQAPGFVVALAGPEHRIEFANAAFRRLFPDRTVTGRPFLDAVPDLTGLDPQRALDDVRRTGEVRAYERVQFDSWPTGAGSARRLWADFVYQPILDEAGKTTGILLQGQDVTAHVLAEERVSLINEELRHRIRNLIAMIGIVARQTLRGRAEPEALETFERRLGAFGTAQATLGGRTDARAGVGAVVEAALAVHDPGGARYLIEGDDTVLSGKQVTTLTLIVHELATNAAKHGALSDARGRVRITWRLGETFVFEWREEGGPEVAPPARTGFGSTLLRHLAEADFEGRGETEFAPGGLVYTLVAPARALGG